MDIILVTRAIRVRTPYRELQWEMLATFRVDDIIKLTAGIVRHTSADRHALCRRLFVVFSLGPIDSDRVYNYLASGGFQWSMHPDTQA